MAFASAPHLKPAPMWLHNTVPPMSKC
nr:hypothetical protein P5621_07085 [Bacillus subtilis]